MHIRKSVSTVFSADKDNSTSGVFAIVPPSVEPPDEKMVSPLQQSLRDYVLRVMRERGLTAVEVARISKRRGGNIARSTIQQIIQANTPNPGILTLRDLALGLTRPLEEVIAHALGEPPSEHQGFLKSDFANLWEVGKDLPLAEQRVFKRVIQMLEREARRVLSGD